MPDFSFVKLILELALVQPRPEIVLRPNPTYGQKGASTTQGPTIDKNVVLKAASGCREELVLQSKPCVKSETRKHPAPIVGSPRTKIPKIVQPETEKQTEPTEEAEEQKIKEEPPSGIEDSQNKNEAPSHITFDILSLIKRELAGVEDRMLSLPQALTKLSILARFPFTIEPGDWFTTRPASLDKGRPAPKCREFLWSHLEPAVPRDREDPEIFWRENKVSVIATLPANYTFGPVYRVTYRWSNNVRQFMV